MGFVKLAYVVSKLSKVWDIVFIDNIAKPSGLLNWNEIL